MPRARKSPLSLATLPPKLQLLIVSHCRVLDAQMLRMTNHHFHSLIPAATPKGHSCTAQAELLEAEDIPWIKEKGLLYCYTCDKLLQREKFSEVMQKVREKRNSKFVYKCKARNRARYCHQCQSRPITFGGRGPRSSGADAGANEEPLGGTGSEEAAT